MALAPESSVVAGVATAGLVYAIFQATNPGVADKRVSEPGDPELDSAERAATWTAAAVVTGVSLLAKDPTIFAVGGASVVALAWLHRHANVYDPRARGVVGPTAAVSMALTSDQD